MLSLVDPSTLTLAPLCGACVETEYTPEDLVEAKRLLQ